MQEWLTDLGRAREGDLDAFGALVHEFQDMPIGYAYSVLRDFGLAEDAAQEAFLEAYCTLGSLREPAAFPGWFRRIVFKHCDRLTRRKRPRMAPIDEARDAAADEPSPREAAERGEVRDRVLAAVNALPEKERTAATLFYINGYSVEEVGSFLEVPATTVKGRLRLARDRLRERMADMVPDTLKEQKPGPEFTELVRRAVRLEKEGRLKEAVDAHKAAFDIAVKLQEEGKFEEAIHAHRAALDAVAGSDIQLDTWGSAFPRFTLSYHSTGKALQLAEGILRAMPADPEPRFAGGVAAQLIVALRAFLKAGKPDRALEVARRILALPASLAQPRRGRWAEIHSHWFSAGDTLRDEGLLDEAERMYELAVECAETVRGGPDHQFLRCETLSRLYRLALQRGETVKADSYIPTVLDNLKDLEKELAAACPGLKTSDDTNDPELKGWFECAGDTYHNVAIGIFGYPERRTDAEALRLIRRAAELRDFAPTHTFLAQLLLAAENDRDTALAHWRKALEDRRFRKTNRTIFYESPDFESVRDDPDFLALLRESSAPSTGKDPEPTRV